MDKAAGESKPREVEVKFSNLGDKTIVEEIFDPENLHPQKQQQAGWLAILNNFKKFVESN